jgi:tetratricopeptide (TPR) repeat protein
LLAAGLPAAASATRSPLADYARARAAGGTGALDVAAEGYASALALAPDNPVLAERALAQALVSGDRALALRAAAALDRAGTLPPDGRILLFGEAVRAANWRAAKAEIARIEKDETFAFLAPILRAWVAQGSGKGDPLAVIAVANGNPLAKEYAAEHIALLQILRGDRAEGIAALAPSLADGGAREQRLRILAAGLAVRKGGRKEALALLEGESAAVFAARTRLASGNDLIAKKGIAAAAMSELLIRIAVEVNAQEVPDLALSFARVATFVAPSNGAAWTVAAELLAAQGRREGALKALASVPAGDAFAEAAADRRIAFLAESERREEALTAALAMSKAEPEAVASWSRLGDLYASLERHSEAADAYARALEITRSKGSEGTPEWALWLMQGSELGLAGKWSEAKVSLEQAYKLAPQEPAVLNHLGYSQLERRENLPEAERLIREASRLQPDDASITDSLGWAHFVRGDLPTAIALLERAAQGQPADPAINEHLGDAYYAAGRRYEARYAWKAASIYAEGAAAGRLAAKMETGLRPDLAAP